MKLLWDDTCSDLKVFGAFPGIGKGPLLSPLPLCCQHDACHQEHLWPKPRAENGTWESETWKKWVKAQRPCAAEWQRPGSRSWGDALLGGQGWEGIWGGQSTGQQGRQGGKTETWALTTRKQNRKMEGKTPTAKGFCLFYKSLLFRIPFINWKESSVYTHTCLCPSWFSQSPDYSFCRLSSESLVGVNNCISKRATHL